MYRKYCKQLALYAACSNSISALSKKMTKKRDEPRPISLL